MRTFCNKLGELEHSCIILAKSVAVRIKEQRLDE